MANETTSTTLNDLCQAVIAESRTILSQSPRLRNYVTERPLQKGKSGVLFPLYDAIAAASVNEGTDLTNTAVSTTGPTVTPTEGGIMTTVTDIADWASNPAQVGAEIGKLFADSCHDLQDQIIWALFDGFTGNTAGTTNVDITEANILNAVQQLLNARAPRPYYLPITPHMFEDLLTLYVTSTSIATDTIRNTVLDKGEAPMIFGVIPILVDSLATGSSAGQRDAADAKSAVFSRGAIGYVEGYDIRVEPQRDASMRGTEIVVTTYFAAGEINDAFGCEMLVDNKD